jgi:hypothetical protein
MGYRSSQKVTSLYASEPGENWGSPTASSSVGRPLSPPRKRRIPRDNQRKPPSTTTLPHPLPFCTETSPKDT